MRHRQFKYSSQTTTDITLNCTKFMGFGQRGVWAMGYCGLMSYGVQFPAHRVGGPEILWVLRVYGLSKAWVMRGSTVVT